MIPAMKHPSRTLQRTRAAAVAAAIATAFSAQAVLAQSTVPEKPAQFQGMETPGSPASLTPNPNAPSPAAALITPLTPVSPRLGFTGSKMVMTQRVWQDYAGYLRNDVAIGYGLFMITVDGQASYVKDCKNYACQISPVTRMQALDECQAKMNKRRCVVFAEGRDIKYAYEVVQ